MGYQSTVVILNDSLDIIENYPKEFVSNLLYTIKNWNYKNRLFESSVPVQGYCNAAEVVLVEDSKWKTILSVGHNTANILNSDTEVTEGDLYLMKMILESKGYKVSKKNV